jgi:8-oxo-dGTP diphosphatase
MSNKDQRPIVGVAIVLYRRDEAGVVRFLIGKRGPGVGHGRGSWGLPGGHLEFNERVIDCAIRELREETGIDLASDRTKVIENGEYGTSFFLEEHRHYITLLVRAMAPKGAEALRMEPDKCEEWRWVTKADLPQPLFAALSDLIARGRL